EIFRLEVRLLAGPAACHRATWRSATWRSTTWPSAAWRSAACGGSARHACELAAHSWRARIRGAPEFKRDCCRAAGKRAFSRWGQVTREEAMSLRICGAAALLLVVSFSARAATTCVDVLTAIGKDLADVTCFVSTDLTTNGTQTTPADNSITTLAPGAFTPQTDRGVIAPAAGKRTPITKAVPVVQINARIASDPQGQARFLLRLPNDWNGRLVVAGASGTRSEFNGDFAWSDYVVQKGYAYASQNKGVLNLFIVTLNSATPPADPLACRLNPASSI